MTPEVILCEMARWQVGNHEVPMPQVTPSNRLLLSQRVSLRHRQIDMFVPKVRHFIAPSGRCFDDDTDVKLTAPHGRDELGGTCLAEPQPSARPRSPKRTKELRQEARGQRPEDADPEVSHFGRGRPGSFERRIYLVGAGAGVVQELLAYIRKVDAGAVTTKQLGANLILDIPDTSTDRRLLDAEVLCRASEATALCGGDDVTHMA
jgi:hypothetical protein